MALNPRRYDDGLAAALHPSLHLLRRGRMLRTRFLCGHQRSHLFVRRLRCDLMISLQDCVALCGLSEEQVLAIAEHEHLPEIAATALAQYLLKREHGMEKIRDMIVDDIRQ